MYQVLARKYRPKNFHQLLGQNHVAKALINAIEQQRLHHAYLFTGTRGVGKTTIARILAKCLNCQTGVTSQPCGVCHTCQAIDIGRFIDLIEIDAASRTKVEDTRELLDNVPYAPTQGRYKVYLIDEVHMLSTHSFNALLKTLEEPPEHVKFLLATTDPQKLPITIVSRCLQFVLRPLPQADLANYLAKILQQEQIDFQAESLWQLANSAKGSVRDALSLTDQAIAFGNGQITSDNVRQMLGLIDQADILAILNYIYQQDNKQLSIYIQQLRQQVVDAKTIFDELAESLHCIALLQIMPDLDLGFNPQQAEIYKQLSNQLPNEMVQLYYEIVTQGREKIGFANTPLQALEMCLLRLFAFKPLASNQIAELPNINHELENKQTELSTQDTVDIAEPIADNLLNEQETTNTYQNDVIEPEYLMLDDVDYTNVMLFDDGQNLQYLSDIQSVESITDDTMALSMNEAWQPEVMPSEQSEQQNHIMIDEPSNNQQDNPLLGLSPEQQVLVGEWTPAKWDYWVYLAREQHWLSDDELVLAKRGYMVGLIEGESQFFTIEQVLLNSMTAQNFKYKLQNHFPNISLSFNLLTKNDEQTLSIMPENKQAIRNDLVLENVKQHILNQSVMQILVKKNITLANVKLVNS